MTPNCDFLLTCNKGTLKEALKKQTLYIKYNVKIALGSHAETHNVHTLQWVKNKHHKSK